MLVSISIEKVLPSIIEIARLSPSVHNTQPWKVKTSENKIFISIDSAYRLVDGDPTGRETIISLGIFSEAISVTANHFGLKTTEILLDEQEAIIRLEHLPGSPRSHTNKQIEALRNRTTDRSIYEHVEIDSKTRDAITTIAPQIKAKIWVLTETEAINEIAALTAKGIGVALSSPSFRRELSKYLIVPWSSKHRGISTSSLYIHRAIAICEPLLMKLGIGIRSEVNLERKRWESASGIILITTVGDMPKYWFEAGRAYLQAALKVEQLGLSQATSAATVEASNYHEDVEKLVDTNQRLQSVIRIGKGVQNRNHSPRVTVEELLTSN